MEDMVTFDIFREEQKAATRVTAIYDSYKLKSMLPTVSYPILSYKPTDQTQGALRRSLEFRQVL